MKGSDILRLCYLARSEYKNEKYSVIFSPDIQLGFGEIHDDDPDCLSLLVGVKELEEYPDQNFGKADTAAPIVDLFHEMGHAVHFDKLFEEQSQLSKAIAFSYFGCKSSVQYYYGCGHRTHPHEIAAEYMGIYGANRFFKKYFGENHAKELLSVYAQEKSVFFDADSDVSSVDSMLGYLNSQFAKYTLKHKNYDVSKDPVFLRACSYDLTVRVMAENVMSKGYGMLQDYMQSVVSLRNLDVYGDVLRLFLKISL